MKKFINGKKYNTATAKRIGDASYSNRTDFAYWYEELYQKKTGEFFLYGEGGPASKYSRATGQNEWSGSEAITPLTLAEAQEWGEKYLDGDEYEQVFGCIEEGKSQISTWVTDSVKADIDKLRDEQGYTLADIFAAGVNALRDDKK